MHICTVVQMVSEMAGKFTLMFFQYQFMNLNLNLFFFKKRGGRGYWRWVLVRKTTVLLKGTTLKVMKNENSKRRAGFGRPCQPGKFRGIIS